ncbi:hypothetical protein I603_2742 [Erythrobacter dokdonensis DSW-74]|uniref:Uncharacterized protein n=1 Tax=Erythrobacter dokdonensis DSW-74 TaxID=1300349 RepID=A0A1A7BDL8_9SPHN|nr:hypothetical protein I603_2742 [Erythrobacter dokdonensis DSW-74]
MHKLFPNLIEPAEPWTASALFVATGKDRPTHETRVPRCPPCRPVCRNPGCPAPSREPN